ncbi:MAG: pyridoxal phosphate-dependent aminotransferase [SAR324 cluster bacterium]|nr:pyridoxal phosphate-dependent aminotransferase [SAR324 cluster bacterium]
MTVYNFDRVISRKNTNCAKWDGAEAIFGEKDLIPMWVADMDIPIARPITEAIRRRTEHEFYGYPVTLPKSVADAVVWRMKRKYNWEVNPAWIVLTPGVVPALNAAVKAFTVPGDHVVHQDPVYYPFWSVIQNNGCQVANNALQLSRGRYEIDFADLQSKFEPRQQMNPLPQRTRMMILCNPHNPVGRVWSRDELLRMGEIVVGNGALMVSDEIHCELLFKGNKHTPFAQLSTEFEQNSLTCMAASKTFNLAGLDASVIIIPNKQLREKFNQAKMGMMPSGSIFGVVALEAAFNEGDEWLEQFLIYMQANLEYLLVYFEKYIPKIKVIKPEGTYLIWLDCRELGLNSIELKRFMNHKAKVGLDHGFVFGPTGEGFERINIACPRSILEAALDRIRQAVDNL